MAEFRAAVIALSSLGLLHPPDLLHPHPQGLHEEGSVEPWGSVDPILSAHAQKSRVESQQPHQIVAQPRQSCPLLESFQHPASTPCSYWLSAYRLIKSSLAVYGFDGSIEELVSDQRERRVTIHSEHYRVGWGGGGGGTGGGWWLDSDAAGREDESPPHAGLVSGPGSKSGQQHGPASYHHSPDVYAPQASSLPLPAARRSPWGFMSRSPGFMSIPPGSEAYLSFPALDILHIPFSVHVKFRPTRFSTDAGSRGRGGGGGGDVGALIPQRQILLSDWGWGKWQFMSLIEADGTLCFTLRRAMYTHGELIAVDG